MDPENAGSRRLIPPLPPSAVGQGDEFGSPKPVAVVVLSDERFMNLEHEFDDRFELVTAPDAGQAIIALRNRNADGDIRLPRGFYVLTDDLATVGFFKRLTNSVPVVVFMAKDEMSASAAREAGANEVLLNNCWL